MLDVVQDGDILSQHEKLDFRMVAWTHGERTRTGLLGKTCPTADRHVKKELPKVPGRKKGEFEGIEENTSQESKKNCGIVSGQEDGMRFCRKLISVTLKLVETNILSSRLHSTFSRSCMMLKQVAQGLCAGEKG